MPDLQPCIRTGSRAFRKGYTGGYTGSDHTKSTSSFMAELIRWMNVKLAPCISIHGVLVDVYGVGVLIMGESGIGKSEAALELIKRGHRLVTDDVVEIRKVSDDTLVGSAPDNHEAFYRTPRYRYRGCEIHVRCTERQGDTEY